MKAGWGAEEVDRVRSKAVNIAGRSLRAAVLGGTLAIALATVPSAAKADCDVNERDGIPDDVIAPIDIAGMRKSLAQAGIGIGGLYLGETFANSGGTHQGGKYDGVLWLYLNGDLKKMGLWKGLCFHADAYQIHGQSITADNINSLMSVSNYEADPATRLSELWLEQHFFNDHMSVRLGQLTADTEFLLSRGGGFFLNSTWSWPSIATADLPSGGPAYPLATPGVRAAITPNDKLSLMIGVYNGDPANPNCTNSDPQVCNSDGLDFDLDSPALLMVEGAYKYDQKQGLAGTIKVGGWNHFGTFPDERFDSAGQFIAVTGNPGRPLENDWGLYGIIDQLIWRVPGSEDVEGVGLFGRLIGAPSGRNLVDFYAEGGITFSGMIPHRPEDTLGIGFAYTGISSEVHTSDVDSGLPVARNYEALLEIGYTMQIKPGWTLQPDFQYFWQPGGNVPNESRNGAVENAAVAGIRSTINF
jgi:porin